MLRGLCAPAAALMQCYTGARLTRFFTSADRFMKSIEPKRLYQSVASQIVKLIKEGEFPPGERLPAERELALKLGVSRPSLREALIALEIGGQVEIRIGSGVYVRDANFDDDGTAAVAALGDSPSELMQARADDRRERRSPRDRSYDCSDAGANSTLHRPHAPAGDSRQVSG